MRSIVRITSLLAIVAMLAACDDDDPAGPGGPFDLTFAGDATFQTPHPNQEIYLAVVRVSDGMTVARDNGTVSASADPSFSFTFQNLLQAGTAYQVHYWIDSNFGGGTLGVCDPMANDHQWNIAVPAPTQDVTITEVHDAQATSPVCGSFAADLSFEGVGGAGTDSYNGPHADQDIEVAIVRSDGLIVAGPVSGTVAATGDPAFTFDFPGALVIDFDYEIHYWIDSNFGGGTVGSCDPDIDIDHQWALAVPTVTADVNVREGHDASDRSLVCDTF